MNRPHFTMQERLDRQAEDRFWNEHRAQDALRAKRIAEQRIQDDLGLLRPGERIVDGLVMYSSMWLDDVPENELARRRAQKP